MTRTEPRSARRRVCAVGAALLAAVMFLLPLPVVVLRPGTSLTLGGCVAVDSVDAVAVRGDYLLTTVAQQRATPAATLLALARNDRQVRAATTLHAAGVAPAERRAIARTRFAFAAQRAAALGLAMAGLAADPDRLVGEGALVVDVVEGSPAAAVLAPGDVIVGVDDLRVATEAQLRAILAEAGPRRVAYTRNGLTRRAVIAPAEATADGEVGAGYGLRIDTLNARVDLPVQVDVVAGTIGGGSGGLMIALAVYDQADATVDLAAGRSIAGTGTLTSDGAVGPVAAVDLKARAAAARGADIFLAPAAQAVQAADLLPATSELEIVGVTSLQDAVGVLQAGAAQSGDLRGPPRPQTCPLAPAT